MQVKQQTTRQPLALLAMTMGLAGALLCTGPSSVLSCPFSISGKGLGTSKPDSSTSPAALGTPTYNQTYKLGKVGLITAGGLGLVALTSVALQRRLKQQQRQEDISATETTLAVDLLLTRSAFPMVVPSEALTSQHPVPAQSVEPDLLVQR